MHPFPSSIDVAHLAHARVPAPRRGKVARLGFYGVIYEWDDTAAAMIAAIGDAGG